jgi:glycosyltransferase involved in cell wall biosynthesis
MGTRLRVEPPGMSILVAHPGTQHAHHLVAGLIACGRDVKYNTVLSFGTDSKWKGRIPASSYSKRYLRDVPDNVIERHPLLEPIPALLQQLGMSSQRAFAFRNRIFQDRITLREIRSSSAIVGFDTSSVILARKAKAEGVPFFLELTQVHPVEKTKWSEFIREKYPQWPLSLFHKPQDLVAQENEELALSTIVSAPAAYVKSTYAKHVHTKNEIVINPFGADIISFKPKKSYRSRRPTFAFMGAITPVKGVPMLLDAWKLAKPNADLIIGGHGEWPAGVTIPEGVRVVGRIPKHERERFLHDADVFLCPSLYEGLSLTQLEAAACGLAVIGTHNSGGSEFLREGYEGFFVEPGNPNALASKIEYFAQHPEQCEAMGVAAVTRVRDFTWGAYAKRWDSVIQRTINPGS